MTKLYNHETKNHEELSPEEESKFGTDPEFVRRYVPQDRKTQAHFDRLIGQGMLPHAATMLAVSSHTGSVPQESLAETTNRVAEIARRHTKPGPNGGSWDTPHTPGATLVRAVATHDAAPATPAAEPTVRTRPAPKPKASRPKARKRGGSVEASKDEEHQDQE